MWKFGRFWVWVFKSFLGFFCYSSVSRTLSPYSTGIAHQCLPRHQHRIPWMQAKICSCSAAVPITCCNLLQGSEIAWLVWETVPGGLAVAGSDFFCLGSHEPLEAATQRWHFQMTVNRVLQSWECQHSCWYSTMPEGPRNGERHRKEFCDLSFIQHQPFLAHSKYLKMYCNTLYSSKSQQPGVPAFTPLFRKSWVEQVGIAESQGLFSSLLFLGQERRLVWDQQPISMGWSDWIWVVLLLAMVFSEEKGSQNLRAGDVRVNHEQNKTYW